MSTVHELGVQEVPVSMIRESKKSLRSAQRDTEAYIELVGSIQQDGLLNPIVLCARTDDETGETYFELIDGVQRYNAILDCGIEVVPANVIQSQTEVDAMRKMIIGNIHRIETRPVEYTKQLQKILALEPLLTVSQLASQLNKSSAWLSQRLGLLLLETKIAELVDEGKINLSNAYALARLPVEDQVNFIDSAITETPGEFVPKIAERKRELDKARREGRRASPVDFMPVPHLRKISEIKGELDSPTMAHLIVKQSSIAEPVDGFLAGIRWCLNLDPISIAEGRRVWESKQKAIADKREAARIERQEKRQKDAELKAERIKLEVELTKEGKTEEEITEALVIFDEKHGLSKKAEE